MKNRALGFIFAIILLLVPMTSFAAQELLCATCGKTIQGSYISLKERPYCSEACVAEALPKCSVCGKTSQRYIKASESPEKSYCSVECFQTTLSKCEICAKPLTHWVAVNKHRYCDFCGRLPRCLNCLLPGADKRLGDGRPICSPCLETAITDQKYAEKLFGQVREDIHSYLNLRTGHPIRFFLKDAAGFRALAGNNRSTQHGFYEASARYQTRRGVKTLVSGSYTIYVLSALSPPHFRNTAAHELAHDIGHEMYPAVQKKEDVEGFAEYISALMNGYWGNDRLNQEKVENGEKEYANAFMKFLKIGEKNGLRDVLAYMEKQNRMAGAR